MVLSSVEKQLYFVQTKLLQSLVKGKVGKVTPKFLIIPCPRPRQKVPARFPSSILHENVSNIVWDELRPPTNIFLDFFQVCLFGKTGPERKSGDASDQGGNVPVFSQRFQ